MTKSVENAQKKVEERNFDIRKNLLEYDDVMNQQRTTLYALRRQILQGEYKTVPTQDERQEGRGRLSRASTRPDEDDAEVARDAAGAPGQDPRDVARRAAGRVPTRHARG